MNRPTHYANRTPARGAVVPLDMTANRGIRTDADTTDIIDSYVTDLASWGAASTTIRDRRVLVRAFLGERHPQNITTVDIVGFLAQHQSQWTKVTYFGHLRSFFTWAHDARVISSDPTASVRRPRTPGAAPRPLTRSQVSALLLAATPRVRDWMILARYAGLRAHAVAQIRGADVNDETLYVIGKGRHAAHIPTHPLIAEMSRRYPPRGYWFPTNSSVGHVQPTTVSSKTRRVFARLGIDGSLHRFRHTFASDLLRSGVNIRVVQSLLRHTSLATTAKYTAVDEYERTEAILGIAA